MMNTNGSDRRKLLLPFPFRKEDVLIRGGYQGQAPTLQDFHAELLRQPEKEAADVALAIEDTAVSGSKRTAAELLKQRKKKATEQPSDPARNSASAPEPQRQGQRHRLYHAGSCPYIEWRVY